MLDINTCFTYAYSAGTSADFYQDISGAEEKSTNEINLDVAGIKIGGANPPWWILRVGTAADACVTMEIKLLSATASGGETGQKVILMYRFTQAQMTAGALLINAPLPHFDYQQWLSLEFTPFTNDNSLTVASWLDTGPQPGVTDIGSTQAGS
jgi:hypothetical protein